MPEPIDIINRAYDCFTRGDFDAFMRVFGEQAVLDEPTVLPYGGTAAGADAIRAMIVDMMDHWDDLRFDLEQVIDGGRTIVGIGTFSARGKGSGVAVRFPIVEFWDFDDQDRLTRLRPIYGDTKQAVDALAVRTA